METNPQVTRPLDNTLSQISTIQALLCGEYEGEMSVSQLLSKGDTGLGTFEGLDGEMIVVDDVCYQARADGSVLQASGRQKVPFACIGDLSLADPVYLHPARSLEALKEQLTDHFKNNEPNSIHIARIHGDFDEILFRSEQKQTPPYKPMNDLPEDNEKKFSRRKISGILVGVYTPQWMKGLNAPGWHLHFLSDDHSCGGHVLGLKGAFDHSLLKRLDKLDMEIPNNPVFESLNLNAVSDQDVQNAEGTLH